MAQSWNANLYDEKHSFVSKYGTDLIALLAAEKGEKILDIGCGTGDLANQLSENGVDVIGIDKSENMIIQASTKYPQIHFQVADVLEIEYEHEFDAIFSNATLHWVKKPEQALNAMYKSLKTGGRFVAELGGKGNVKLITDEIINQLTLFGVEYNQGDFPWYFPSIGEYATLMEKTGFRVTFAHHFDRPTPLQGKDGLRNWIDMFAGNILKDLHKDSREEIITNTENSLQERLYKNDTWVADYKRIRVVGIKE